MAFEQDAGALECRFELLQTDAGFQVRFLAGDLPPLERPFGFELSPSSRARGVIARIEQGICTRSDLQDVGSQLWNALRPPGIREAFEALERQADESHPLFVWLDIPPDATVERLPWEALHDELASSFLGTDLRYCLLRPPPRGSPRISLPPTAQRPLRVLVVIPEGSGLQVQYEWNNLRSVARSLGETLHTGLVEGRVTPDRLLEELKAGPWDVLHYIGHGEVSEEGFSLRLNRETSELGDFWMDAATFASLVQGQHLRLALLNCCLGASPSVSRTLSGLGPLLVRTARVPAVIAMRYEISDTVSIRFADSFYRELLTGHAPGHVAIAVQQARRSLRINASGDTVRGFITPMLYLSPGCERLFDIRPAPAPAPQRVEPVQARSTPWLPEALVRGLLHGRCLPVVGPGLHRLTPLSRRRGQETRLLAPTLGQLIHRLARECGYPEEEELLRMEQARDWYLTLLLARICQHYQRNGRRYELIESLQTACEHAEPPECMRQLATWDVPGIFYLHFDGLMEEALQRARKLSRVLNRVEQSLPGEHAEPLLVNVLGTLTQASSLALTETDRDHLLWERLSRASSEVVDLIHQMGRGLLFLGVSPRDSLARRLAGLLEVGEASMQGPCFFVSTEATQVDAAYWAPFNVQWIREEPAAVIEALTARLEEEAR
ncbi:MAG TPA: CHAT domain-containing protein [Archangium sp.]|uniref:CHAT domain-containing protein n=1 Tax=Archangium sp. TaxID=1872627 RepID=UPI002E333E5C|nr:CHAT domain-containing protein [Archangium sp.]HEX5746311.1 CHAT domain-containing protein [Archangium sp.]